MYYLHIYMRMIFKMWIALFEKYKKQSKEYMLNIIKIIKGIKGELFQIPHKEIVVLLFSGGMDSVTLLDLIINVWNCRVILIYYQRNSKNQIFEEQSVSFFYDFYKEKYPENILELIFLPIEIPSKLNKEFFDRERQEIFGLPLRNNIMWSNAFTQAIYLSGKYKSTIRTVICGSVIEDLNTNESGTFSILSYNLNLCASLGLFYYQLLAPFIDGSLGRRFNKKDLVNYASKNKIPLEKSRSCFSSSQEPCNECLACKNRNDAYKK